MNKRKNLRRAAEGQNPGRPIKWAGGMLCFTDTGEPVPNVINIPKPGARVIGWTGCGAQIYPPQFDSVVYDSSRGSSPSWASRRDDSNWRGFGGYHGRDYERYGSGL
ncbi:hypothetical protein HY971_03265 [Candidatus Kaiserbacteria bacterium]|nr:hypothetical protein [Candidatus Kaiserbacteria bacterium]